MDFRDETSQGQSNAGGSGVYSPNAPKKPSDQSGDVIDFGQGSADVNDGAEATRQDKASAAASGQIPDFALKEASKVVDDSSSECPELPQIWRSILEKLKRDGSIDERDYLERYPALAAPLRKIFMVLKREKAIPSSQPLESSERDQASKSQAKQSDRIDPGIPRQLGNYELINVLGRGGMGVVFLARDLNLNREVALKVLPVINSFDRTRRLRFENEARSAARLQHPNIVSVHEYGNDDGIYYFAMQRIAGKNLAEWIEQMKRNPMVMREFGTGDTKRTGMTKLDTIGNDPTLASGADDPGVNAALESQTSQSGNRSGSTNRSGSMVTRPFCQAVAKIGMQAASGLHYAHELGVVHRDVKPSNLMIDADGKVWITDFGLAHTSDSQELTKEGEVMGTWRYMSPEQATGHSPTVDHRTDVYSLGATLYELLVLEPAVPGKREMEIRSFLNSKSPKSLRRHDKRIPEDLATIIEKAMSRNPDDRYVNARAMAEDLKAFIEARPIKAKRAPLIKRVLQYAQRHQRLAAIVSVAMVFGALAALGTAGAAMRFGFQASTERDVARAETADERAKRLDAEVGSLVAQSSGMLARDPSRALKVASEALEARDDFASRAALANAWLANQRLFVTSVAKYGHASDVWVAANEEASGELKPQVVVSYLIDRTSQRLVVFEASDAGLAVKNEYVVRGAKPVVSSDLKYAVVQSVAADGAPADAEIPPSVSILDLSTGIQTPLNGAKPLGEKAGAITSDSDRVATAGEDGKLVIWKVSSGARLSSFDVGSLPLTSAVWADNGERVAVVNQEDSIWIVDTGESKLVQELPLHRPRRQVLRYSDIRNLEFSHDAKQLLVNSIALGIHLADTDGSGKLRSLRRPSNRTWEANFIPGTDLVALWATQESVIPLFHREDGAMVAQLDAGGLVSKVVASPSGGRLLVRRMNEGFGVQAPAPILYSLLDSNLRVTLLTSDSDWNAFEWSSDARVFATVGDQGEVSIWNPVSQPQSLRHVTRSMGPPLPVTLQTHDDQMVFSTMGRQAVASIDSSGRRRWSQMGEGAADQPGIHAYANGQTPVIVVRGGRFSQGENDGVAVLVDPVTGEVVREHRGNADYAWGNWLSSREYYVLFNQRHRVELRDHADGELVWRSPDFEGLSEVSLSPFANAMLVGLLDQGPHLVEVVDGVVSDKPLELAGVEQLKVTSVGWHSDGDRFVVVFDRALVAIGSRSAGTIEWVAQTQTPVSQLLFSADGSAIALLAQGEFGAGQVHVVAANELLAANEVADGEVADGQQAPSIADLPTLEWSDEGVSANHLYAIPGSAEFAAIHQGSAVSVVGLGQEPMTVYEGVAVTCDVSGDGAEIVVVEAVPTVGQQAFVDMAFAGFSQRQRSQNVIAFAKQDGNYEETRRTTWKGGLVTEVDFGDDGSWVLFMEDFGVEFANLEGSSRPAFQFVGGHSACVTDMARLSHGLWASGSLDHSVQLWSESSGELVGESLDHPSSITKLAAAPESRRLAVGTQSGVIRIWDFSQATPSSVDVELGSRISEISWLEEDRIGVLTAAGEWVAIDGQGAELSRKKLTEGQIQRHALSPDSQWLVWTETAAMPQGLPLGMPPGMLPTPAKIKLVRLTDATEPSELPAPASQELPIDDLAWMLDSDGLNQPLALQAGVAYRLAGMGGENEWRMVGALPEANDIAADGSQLFIVAPRAVMLLSADQAEPIFTLEGLLEGAGLGVYAHTTKRLAYNEGRNSWWVLEESGSLIEVPADLLEQAISQGSHLSFE